jgi:hypothetical protein
MQSHSQRNRRGLLSIAGLAVLWGGGWVGDSTANADSPANRMARWTGWGWSEGYHSATAERDPRAGLPPIGYSSQTFREGLFQPVELTRPRRHALGYHRPVAAKAFAFEPYSDHLYDVGPTTDESSVSPLSSKTTGASGQSVLSSGSSLSDAENLRPRSQLTGPPVKLPPTDRPGFPQRGAEPAAKNQEPNTPSPSDRQPQIRQSPDARGVERLPAPKADGFGQRDLDEARSSGDSNDSTWQRFLRLSSEEWFQAETGR